MLLKAKEVPGQKYELADLSKFSLHALKRKYELGMVFTAMLSREKDERAIKAIHILMIQMKNIWDEWRVRMARRELQGLPALEIWQRVSKKDLIAIANKNPAAVARNIRRGKPLVSDQVVFVNTLDFRSNNATKGA